MLKELKIKMYYEKSVNSNPYYAINKELNLLSKVLSDLITNDLIKDKLAIGGFRGGTRNPIVNECELDFTISLESNESDCSILNIIDELANKYEAKYIVERGVNL